MGHPQLARKSQSLGNAGTLAQSGATPFRHYTIGYRSSLRRGRRDSLWYVLPVRLQRRPRRFVPRGQTQRLPSQTLLPQHCVYLVFLL